MNRLLLKECLDELRSYDYPYRILDEGKDRLIDRLPSLDDAQKARMKRFFAKRPSLESKFDWNRPNTITWDSFAKLEGEYPEPIDPDTVPEFSDKRDEGNGIVSYLVQDDDRGREAVRRVMDTHWGADADPWCIVSDRDCWEIYSAMPKLIAFKNGRLLAFMGTEGDREGLEWEYTAFLEENGIRDIELSYLDWYKKYAPDFLKHTDEETWWDRNNKPFESVHDCE